MKKQITTALLGFGMFLVLAASAPAQTSRRMSVLIPFDFVAGKTQLKAGGYTVRRVAGGSETALLLESEDGRSKATVITNSAGESPERAQLVFRQHGESYFLAEISIPGTASVRALPKSRGEKNAERLYAAKGGARGDKTVTVAGTIR